MKNIIIYGNINEVKKYISNKIIKKYGDLSSLIYVSIPKDKKVYNESLNLFATEI